MKVKILSCKRCKSNTTHVKESDMPTGAAVFFGIFTLGWAAAMRTTWYKCTCCGNIVDN